MVKQNGFLFHKAATPGIEVSPYKTRRDLYRLFDIGIDYKNWFHDEADVTS